MSTDCLQNTTKENNPAKEASHELEKDGKKESRYIKVTEFIEPAETDDIHTFLKKGLKAKVYDKSYADCMIMDFAGHKVYYSTHQTFLTRNAVYLIVFSLIKDDPFVKTGDEEG